MRSIMTTRIKNYHLISVTLVYILFLNAAWSLDCPKIKFERPLELSLNENELSLLCPQSQQGRQSIPHYQAKFYLKGFLQSRGHPQPTFKTEGTTLFVSQNKKSYLKNLESANADLKEEVLRFYKGKIVTPLLLDKIEAFIIEYHRKEGHPCPRVSLQYIPKKNLLKIDVQGLKSKNFGEVFYEEVPGLHQNFIKRFEAFKPKQIYNSDKLELTKKRIFRSNIVQSTYYQKSCEDLGEKYKIRQNFVPGPPRTLRFGIGANTEVGPMVRLRWANHRYKKMGSLLQANLQASLKEQGLSLKSDMYLWTSSPRRSWKSELKINRTSESDYEEISSSLSQKIKWTKDGRNHHFLWQTGPSVETSWFKTDQNNNRKSLVMPSWQADLKIQSHDYELYNLFPQKGHQLKASADLRPTWLNNKFDIYQFKFKSVKLFSLTTWGRGDLVAGVRFNYQSTWVKDEIEAASVPPGLRSYGGGESQNRGQRLNSLPKNNGLGALTHALLRLELRRTHVFVPELEALIFSDFSKFSERPWRTQKSTWVSPGLGLRWLSPIGPVQTYAARSLKYNPHLDNGYYLFVGLGGEL